MKQIIYIMGRGHSGSTILDALLGNAPNTVGVGELVSGWNRTEGRCSCGKTAGDCEFWGGVRRRFQTTVSRDWTQAGHVAAWQANVLRFGLTVLKRAPHPEMTQMTADAFECIGDEAGVGNVIDSGKEFTRALFLLRNFKTAKVIFLVRRCDAVLASQSNRIQDGTGFRILRMRLTSRTLAPLFLIVTAINWVIGNAIGECIRLAFPKCVLRVRYEDLCSNPGDTLARLGTFLSVDLGGVARNIAARNAMATGHKIAGNRMRGTGSFVFNPQLANPRPLSSIYQVAAWIVGAPLLWHYGYWGIGKRGVGATNR